MKTKKRLFCLTALTLLPMLATLGGCIEVEHRRPVVVEERRPVVVEERRPVIVEERPVYIEHDHDRR